ncbi:MAG: hypothetical protein OXF99_02185 [bacterium]|nr:hypothetical protein [bacterium]
MALCLLISGLGAAAAEAQLAAEDSVEARIAARWHADGRVEFALQQRQPDSTRGEDPPAGMNANGEGDNQQDQPDDTWGEHLLVQRRVLRPETIEFGTGTWKYSTQFDLEGGIKARIAARWRSDGRVEFALQQRQRDNSWGQHLFVQQRLLQPETVFLGAGTWKYSTPYTLTTPMVQDQADGAEVNRFTIPEGPRGDDTLITAGRGRTCAVEVDGGVACWGRYGLVDRFALAGLNDVVSISMSDSQRHNLHACAVHEDRTISCWGDGNDGRLGQGDNNKHFFPVKVPRVTDAVAVSAGEWHTCALHSDGGVSCWGLFYSAGIVGGANGPDYSLRRVVGLSDVAMISAGRATHCAIHSDGDISCWGVHYPVTDSGPERVRPRQPFTSVSTGWDRICAVSVAGNVYCWGYGGSPATATRVGGLADVVDVSVGNANTCVLHRDGGVSCWGRNEAGEVGDGTTTSRELPKRVEGISDAVAVSISNGSDDITAHVCALRADGSALCWGGNEVGQLGDGTNQSRLVPTSVEPIPAIPADQVPLTPTELMRTWAEAIVQEREADYPWMRVAWDHIRDQAIASQSGYGGLVYRSCHASAESFGCSAVEMQITSMVLGTFVHELLHAYDFETGLAPRKEWGAVQLYFATTYPGCYDRGDISGAEILADTVNHLIVPTAWLTYYESRGCPNITPGSRPTAEAEQVVLQGLAGQVPDWYSENITNGAELWAAWRRGPSLPALANLADEFGGLCSTDWIRYPLDPELFPSAGSNPFKDGGCP